VLTEAEIAEALCCLERYDRQLGGSVSGDLRLEAHLLLPWLWTLVRHPRGAGGHRRCVGEATCCAGRPTYLSRSRAAALALAGTRTAQGCRCTRPLPWSRSGWPWSPAGGCLRFLHRPRAEQLLRVGIGTSTKSAADPGRAADPGWRDGTLPRPAWPGPLLCHTPEQPGQWRPCVLRRCISPGRRAPLPLRPACAAAQARGGGTSEGVLGELRGPGPAGLQALQLAHRSRPGGAGPGLSTPFTTSRSPAGNSVLDASVRHSARGLSPPTPPPNPAHARHALHAVAPLPLRFHDYRVACYHPIGSHMACTG
jgi:hypothetical protein